VTAGRTTTGTFSVPPKRPSGAPANTTICPLQDVPDLAHTVAEWLTEQWPDGLSVAARKARLLAHDDRPPALLATLDNVPAGVLAFSRFTRAGDETPSLFIDALYVHAPVRQRGLGAALLVHGVTAAGGMARRLFVYTSIPHWYASRGWSVLEKGPDADRFLDTPGAHFGCNVKKINVDQWEGTQTDCDLIGGGSGGPLFTYINNKPAIAGVASTTHGNFTVPQYTLDGPQNTHSPTTQIYDYPMRSAQVGVGLTSNGRLQVYISDLDSASVKSKWQQTTTSAGPLGYTHYINFTPPGAAPGAIAVSRLTDGRQQMFYLQSGSLFTKFQTSVDGGWVTPYATATPGNGVATDLATVELLDGTPMLFASTSDGKLYYKQKLSTDPSAGWTDWIDISPTGQVSKVSVVRHPAGTLDVFAVRTNGTVASRVRQSNGNWLGWGEFDSAHAVVDIAAGVQGNGRAQLFEIDDAGHLFTIWKTAQEDYSSWSTWTPIGYFFGLPSTRTSTILKAISVGTLPDGRLELFGVSSDATPYTLVQTTANTPTEFGDPTASSRFWMEF